MVHWKYQQTVQQNSQIFSGCALILDFNWYVVVFFDSYGTTMDGHVKVTCFNHWGILKLNVKWPTNLLPPKWWKNLAEEFIRIFIHLNKSNWNMLNKGLKMDQALKLKG